MKERSVPATRLAALLFALLPLAAISVSASHHVADESDPTIPTSVVEIHTHGRVFVDFDEVDLMLEYVGRFEGTEKEYRYQALTLGGYYRIHRNLKLGAFYRLQFNARRDDDWIEDGSVWVWSDPSDRLEQVGIIDLTPRFMLDFLPGRNWVGAVKGRYEYNFATAGHTLLIRPGLTFFWLHDREPVMNISAQYGIYFSLNYGVVPWYGHGPYVNVLYHLHRNIQLDVGIRRQWVYWSESTQFSSAFPGETYEENIYSPWSLDLGLILRL